MYAKEQMKLGFKYFLKALCTEKGKFCVRKKIPFKDTQCADCVNSSLLVDALIVTKIRGIKR